MKAPKDLGRTKIEKGRFPSLSVPNLWVFSFARLNTPL